MENRLKSALGFNAPLDIKIASLICPDGYVGVEACGSRMGVNVRRFVIERRYRLIYGRDGL